MTNFAIIGAGGYIAPKHMKAIKDTGNRLVAAMDIHDAVGVLDSYFGDTLFFTDITAFESCLQQLRGTEQHIDYVVVCTPNYLHMEHIALGLRSGANVICEKPVALFPEDVQKLQQLEKEYDRKIYTILQLRLHPAIVELKRKVAGSGTRYRISLDYITARGDWYQKSWKGDLHKSGGIGTNIGIHLFDLLQWIFGAAEKNEVDQIDDSVARGKLTLNNAEAEWLLSIRAADLPGAIIKAGKRVFRELRVNGEVIDFSEGLEDLHTQSYEAILNGNGFALEETLPSIRIVTGMRNRDK